MAASHPPRSQASPSRSDPGSPGPSDYAPRRDRKGSKRCIGSEFNAVVASPPLPDPGFAGSLGLRSEAPLPDPTSRGPSCNASGRRLYWKSAGQES
jgi:hypothetical protein